MAVAVRRDVHCHIYVERRTVLADCLCVLRHLAVQKVTCIPLFIADCVKGTGPYAASAAFADVLVNERLVILVRYSVRAALLGTAAAAAAELFIDLTFTGGMLLHLTGAASATHTEILDASAKARHFMSFEMCKAYDNIRVHYCTSDFCGLAVLGILHRNLDLVGAAETVGNYNLTACSCRIESVVVRTVKVLQRMLSAPRIKSIAVCEERYSSLLLYKVSNRLGILRTKIREVAKLTEMHLDSNKFSFHVDVLDARGNTKPFKLFCLGSSYLDTKIRKIHFSFFHFSQSS